MKTILLCAFLAFVGAAASPRTAITRYEQRSAAASNDEFGWVTPHELMEHLHTMSRLIGSMSPRKVPGYSHAIARTFHRHLVEKSPELIDHLVNLGHHYAGADLKRKLSGREIVPNVAAKLRAAHKRRMQEATGSSRILEVTEIETCPADPVCNQAPCTPAFLDSSYTPFPPAYGGEGGFNAAVASIKGTLYWSGNIADRSYIDGYSANLIALRTATIAESFLAATCDAIDDDIPICILCVIFEVPNPGKVVCEVIDAVFQIAKLILESFKSQMEYQDGMVQSAEIEASYEHTRNLLHKQCAIYDEVLCRCSQALAAGDGYGLGCDGMDSNCNDEIDECDEDLIPPKIDVAAVLEHCGGYFASLSDAENCVRESVVATDDCQEVEISVTSSGTCETAQVTITAKETSCEKTTTATVPVLVDATKPQVGCNFNRPNMTTTGPRLPIDVGLNYSASDDCGQPLNVTVKMYSSEIENFNAQEMALFFESGRPNNAAGVYLAAKICPTSNNGQCIKDPTAKDARLYTAVVSATDAAGNSNEAECQIKVVPQGNLTGKAISTTATTQRFFLSSYSSLFH